MTRDRLRLTTVECTVCQATTTSNWSRVCSKCSKALLAADGSRSPTNPHFPARVCEGDSEIGNSVLPVPHTSTEGDDLTMLDRLRRSKPQVRGGLTTP